jgi:cellobiose-specific phosphotransferase system component IIB
VSTFLGATISTMDFSAAGIRKAFEELKKLRPPADDVVLVTPSVEALQELAREAGYDLAVLKSERFGRLGGVEVVLCKWVERPTLLPKALFQPFPPQLPVE